MVSGGTNSPLRWAIKAGVRTAYKSIIGASKQPIVLSKPSSNCLLKSAPSPIAIVRPAVRWFSTDAPLVPISDVEDLGEHQSSNFQDQENTYSSQEITVTGRDPPKPFMQFDDYDWSKEVKEVILREKYGYPTPIQCQGLPIALEGRDLVGIAQTGSGKTLSFLLPAIVRIGNQETKGNARGLILGPTRELVQQTYSVACKFRKSISSVCLYGGSSKNHQLMELRKKPDLLIATPGRLIDLVGSGHISLNDINFLVFDEADRMLDMGFEPQIREIVSHIPNERQTLMWSATWPEDVRSLAEEYLNDYIQIIVGSTELHANHNIKQNVRVMTEVEKQKALLEILNELRKPDERTEKTLIFTQTKRVADAIAAGLRRRGIKADSIHSDKSQAFRDKVLNAYRENRLDVLIGTDVAARGLDVNDIQVVINYDYPQTTEDYVHRIGRTGRVNNKGTAYTFLTVDNLAEAPALIKIMEEANQEVPNELRELADMAQQTRKERNSFRNRYQSNNKQFGGQYGSPRKQFGRDNFSQRRNDKFSGGFRSRAGQGYMTDDDEDPMSRTSERRFNNRNDYNNRYDRRQGSSRSRRSMDDYDHERMYE